MNTSANQNRVNELYTWVKANVDINEVERTYPSLLNDKKPIGDFVYNQIQCILPINFRAQNAMFEILSILVPKLDEIKIDGLDGRFSSDLYNTILTDDELNDFKSNVWARLSNSHKNLLRQRVKPREGHNIVNNADFLDARQQFWKLMADALRSRHAETLIETYAQVAGSRENAEVIVCEFFDSNTEKFSTIYPVANNSYFQWISAYIQIRIELLYWIKRAKDLDPIAHDLCICDGGKIDEPIGDFVYKRLTNSKRGYKTVNQKAGAAFETLAIVVPRLASEISLSDLNAHSERFSRQLFDAIPIIVIVKKPTSDESTSDESTSDESTSDESTSDESTSDESTSDESIDLREMIWKPLTEAQKNLLIQRVISPEGANIATDLDFLETARDLFWELTRAALGETYTETLNQKLKAAPIVSNFFGNAEKFSTVAPTREQPDGSYTENGFYTWMLKSIKREKDRSSGNTNRERLQTVSEVERGLEKNVRDPSPRQDNALVDDEITSLLRSAIEFFEEILPKNSASYTERGMTIFKNCSKNAPQLVFILLTSVLDTPILKLDLRTGLHDSDEADITGYEEILDRLQNPHREVADRKMSDTDRYELLQHGFTDEYRENAQKQKEAVRQLKNQILNAIKNWLLKNKMEALQELLSENSEPVPVDQVKKFFNRSNEMIWERVADIWLT